MKTVDLSHGCLMADTLSPRAAVSAPIRSYTHAGDLAPPNATIHAEVITRDNERSIRLVFAKQIQWTSCPQCDSSVGISVRASVSRVAPPKTNSRRRE